MHRNSVEFCIALHKLGIHSLTQGTRFNKLLDLIIDVAPITMCTKSYQVSSDTDDILFKINASQTMHSNTIVISLYTVKHYVSMHVLCFLSLIIWKQHVCIYTYIICTHTHTHAHPHTKNRHVPHILKHKAPCTFKRDNLYPSTVRYYYRRHRQRKVYLQYVSEKVIVMVSEVHDP